MAKRLQNSRFGGHRGIREARKGFSSGEGSIVIGWRRLPEVRKKEEEEERGLMVDSIEGGGLRLQVFGWG